MAVHLVSLQPWHETAVHAPPLTPMDALMKTPPFGTVPPSKLEFARLGMLVDTAFEVLDPLDADIVIAKVYEHLSFSQIGQRFGISKSNAHWRYTRALGLLREWLVEWAKGTTARQKRLHDAPNHVTARVQVLPHRSPVHHERGVGGSSPAVA